MGEDARGVRQDRASPNREGQAKLHPEADDHEKLKELSRKTGKNMSSLIDSIVEEHGS